MDKNNDKLIEPSSPFLNLIICGEKDAGKCTLSKTLTQTNGSISNLNFFKIENQNYHTLKVPCFVDYSEVLQTSSSLADISIILITNVIENECYCKNFKLTCKNKKI